MSNIANVLKTEISRVARKEARGESQQLKRASTQYRSDIAALKRRILALETQVKRLNKSPRKSAPSSAHEAPASSVKRFSAKGLAAQRRRLNLSAPQMAALLNVSAQSIYKWEDGKTRPRASQMPAIATLRKMNKKAAAARLEELAEQA